MKSIVALGFLIMSTAALAASPPQNVEPETLSCKRLRAVCDTGQECCSGHCTLQYGGHYHCGD